MNSDLVPQAEISSAAGPDSFPSKQTGEERGIIPFPQVNLRSSSVSRPSPVHGDREKALFKCTLLPVPHLSAHKGQRFPWVQAGVSSHSPTSGSASSVPCWDRTDPGDVRHICLDEGRKTAQHYSDGTTLSFLPRRTDRASQISAQE